MKKVLALLIAVIALVLTALLGCFALLHTQYATPVSQLVVERLSKGNITFESVEYQYPLHFRFHHLVIHQDKQTIPIAQADIWLNATLIHDNQLVIDSILLDGLNLQHDIPNLPRLPYLYLHQLALHNVDIAHQGWVARGVNTQIKHPSWSDKHSSIPFGEIQFSAEQLYWQGEALNNVLLDMDYKPHNSTVYGLSFTWQDAAISGQAEQYPQGWSLVNVTVDKLNLNANDSKRLTQISQAYLTNQIDHINSLDILNSNLTMGDVNLRNVDISLENLYPYASLWQQEQGYVSLRADDATWFGQQWVEPSISIETRPGQLIINDFNAELYQGDIQLSGSMTPSSLSLKQLNVRGLKWVNETAHGFDWFAQLLSSIENMSIEKLNIGNSQVIQLAKAPYWQLSGVNIEGYDLTLIDNKRFGLWQGELQITANSASYDSVLATQSVIEMHSDQGKWSLDRLFIPLEKGYIDAIAKWDFNAISEPWQTEIHADGFPLSLINNALPLPFSIEGVSEFEVQLQGLASDHSTLAHSLTGSLKANLREATLLTSNEYDQRAEHPFNLDDLTITADRGRIKIEPAQLATQDIQLNIIGNVDLLDMKNAQINVDVKQTCRETRFELIHDKQQMNYSCDPQESDNSANSSW